MERACDGWILEIVILMADFTSDYANMNATFELRCININSYVKAPPLSSTKVTDNASSAYFHVHPYRIWIDTRNGYSFSTQFFPLDTLNFQFLYASITSYMLRSFIAFHPHRERERESKRVSVVLFVITIINLREIDARSVQRTHSHSHFPQTDNCCRQPNRIAWSASRCFLTYLFLIRIMIIFYIKHNTTLYS